MVWKILPKNRMDQLSDEQLQRSTEQLQTAVRQLQLETDVFERFLQRVDPWEHAASAAPAASSVQSATPSISPAQSASDVSTSDQSARSTLRGARRAGKPSGKTPIFRTEEPLWFFETAWCSQTQMGLSESTVWDLQSLMGARQM
ncbi:hypothetical protein FJT64_007159 [Amphibalanus amphitrite]|uniref:Uncharacterized protein n=1 Tax=Amphibalanus amphitrite TaxID=1232801 RepID=A0A6A4VZH0_AMPAM|nr:hypothetical protein FJT64_007159 [Amphibalanus amphitrite]